MHLNAFAPGDLRGELTVLPRLNSYSWIKEGEGGGREGRRRDNKEAKGR